MFGTLVLNDYYSHFLGNSKQFLLMLSIIENVVITCIIQILNLGGILKMFFFNYYFKRNIFLRSITQFFFGLNF